MAERACRELQARRAVNDEGLVTVVDPFAIRSAPTAALPLPRYVYPGTAVERPYSKHAWRRGCARGQGETTGKYSPSSRGAPAKQPSPTRGKALETRACRGAFPPFAPSHPLIRSRVHEYFAWLVTSARALAMATDSSFARSSARAALCGVNVGVTGVSGQAGNLVEQSHCAREVSGTPDSSHAPRVTKGRRPAGWPQGSQVAGGSHGVLGDTPLGFPLASVKTLCCCCCDNCTGVFMPSNGRRSVGGSGVTDSLRSSFAATRSLRASSTHSTTAVNADGVHTCV